VALMANAKDDGQDRTFDEGNSTLSKSVTIDAPLLIAVRDAQCWEISDV
jgi:hypothetical protein